MIDYLKTMTVFDWVGIVGSLLICAGYLSVSRKWMAADARTFHVVNLAGATLLLLSLYFRPNPGAILIELIWASIAIYSLVFTSKGANSEIS